MISHRATGVVELLTVLAAMALGAVFTIFVYELGISVRPVEMRVWGNAESLTGSNVSSQGGADATSASTTSNALSAGITIFQNHCTSCHPRGGRGVGPALNTADLKQRYPQNRDLIKAIREGKDLMPAYSVTILSDKDMEILVGYIRSMAAEHPSVPASSVVAQSNPSVLAGKTTFERLCNMCHPGARQGLGPSLSSPEFREKYLQDADIAVVIRNGRNGMPGFKSDRISDEEIASIITYLRSIP